MQLALRNIKYNWLLSDKYLSTFTDINGRALYQNVVGLHLKCGVLYLTKCSLTTPLTTRPIRRHKWLHALRLIHACNYTDDCVTAVYISMYTRLTPQSTVYIDRTILTLFTIAKEWLHRRVVIVRSKKLWATKLGKKKYVVSKIFRICHWFLLFSGIMLILLTMQIFRINTIQFFPLPLFFANVEDVIPLTKYFYCWKI